MRQLVGGKVVVIYHNGDKYEGEWTGGMSGGWKQGSGTFTLANGDKYVGDFADGKEEGRGVMTFAVGGVYDGEWENYCDIYIMWFNM
ncbi:hypothetical protein FACS1894152_7600 [Bacilli bacterium]|nr:hypothetical protein FACS1894152_7600 [Bacilli bacterium]